MLAVDDIYTRAASVAVDFIRVLRPVERHVRQPMDPLLQQLAALPIGPEVRLRSRPPEVCGEAARAKPAAKGS